MRQAYDYIALYTYSKCFHLHYPSWEESIGGIVTMIFFFFLSEADAQKVEITW